MKSNVFKIGLPMAVAAFALASAAGTSSMSEKGKVFLQPGYQRTTANPTPCNYVQDCDENGNFACKASSGVQLYSINCLTPLKRSTP
jgi:hypothetical protein